MKLRLSGLNQIIIAICLSLAGLTCPSHAQFTKNCNEALELRTLHLEGAKLLHEINPRMHLATDVEGRAARHGKREQNRLVKPVDKISAWLASFAQMEQRTLANPTLIHHIKAYIYRHNVIGPDDIPAAYFATQARILRNDGYGDVEITPSIRASIQDLLIKDQALSIEPWIDYLLSPERAGENYPTWIKYWILSGVLKLSIYDPVKRAFGIRNQQTVAPFPELNRDALGKTRDLILTRLNQASMPNPVYAELASLIRTANFGQLYGSEINKLSQYGNRPFSTNDGRWVRYSKNSDSERLVEALAGQNTGWCTAGRGTARAHLGGGDFYVYFSQDLEGQFTRPRLAIRMQGDRIGEIRGVGLNQEFDPMISESNVLDEKLKEFGDKAEAYRRKSADMKRLTEIEARFKRENVLSTADIRFLREVDHKIQGFGYSEDPRIAELLKGRDLRADIALIFAVEPSQVALSLQEFAAGHWAVYVGDLAIDSSNANLALPTMALIGDVTVGNLKAPTFYLPSIQITGSLTFSHSSFEVESLRIDADVKSIRFFYLKELQDVQFPQVVESLEFVGVKTIKALRGLSQLKHLQKFKLEGLEVAGDLELPALQENWTLSDLQSVNSLTLAPGVKSLYLPKLVSAQSIAVSPDLRSLRLPKLKSTHSIQSLPPQLKELILGGIQSAQGLDFPPDLERLWLDSLTDVASLERLPAELKSLELDNLEKADGLDLPASLDTLWLPKLESAQGIARPPQLQQMRYRGPTDFKPSP